MPARNQSRPPQPRRRILSRRAGVTSPGPGLGEGVRPGSQLGTELAVREAGPGQEPPAQDVSHSHVVEAKQVVASEGPERGHLATAATLESRLVSTLCSLRRKSPSSRGELLPGLRLVGRNSSDSAPSGGQSQELQDHSCKVSGCQKQTGGKWRRLLMPKTLKPTVEQCNRLRKRPKK